MKFIGPHFYIAKKPSNALLVLVVLLLCVFFLKDFIPVKPPMQWEEQVMAQHQKWIDSTAKSSLTKPIIYPFNPNNLTDHRAYVLGMEPYSIDRLLSFRKSGKWIHSAEEFKSVTGIEDDLMA
jgi:hypothetical protein